MNGTYRYEVVESGVVNEVFESKDPISLKKDITGIQTQFGVSLNFSTMGALSLNYAMAESNSVGFNLRFYINNGE
jgi:hypothetical protein